MTVQLLRRAGLTVVLIMALAQSSISAFPTPPPNPVVRTFTGTLELYSYGTGAGTIVVRHHGRDALFDMAANLTVNGHRFGWVDHFRHVPRTLESNADEDDLDEVAPLGWTLHKTVVTVQFYESEGWRVAISLNSISPLARSANSH